MKFLYTIDERYRNEPTEELLKEFECEEDLSHKDIAGIIASDPDLCGCYIEDEEVILINFYYRNENGELKLINNFECSAEVDVRYHIVEL